MLRFILTCCIGILVCALPFVAKGKTHNDSLDKLIRSDPAGLVALLKPKTQHPNANPNDLLLLSKAYLHMGRYNLVDSIVEFVYQHYSFKSDSALYIEFVGVEGETKKILEIYDESLACLKKIQQYTQRNGDTLDLIEVYLKYAEYYRAAANYDLAIIYLNKANELGMYRAAGFPPMLKERMMNRKAAVYLEKGIYLDSVELLSKTVIQLATRHNNPNLVASSSNELGFLYLNIHPLGAGADGYFKNAIAIWDKLGYSNSAHNARLNLARYYLKAKKPQDAIALANTCLQTTREFGWVWDESYWNEILSVAYEQIHDYKRALHYLNIAKEGLLKLSTTQYKERLAYYANKLEYKSKEEELRQKNREVEKARFEINDKSRENRLLFYMISFLLVVLLGSITFTLYTRRQKKMLTQQKKEISTINEQLRQLVNQKETLLKEINHRVKNNLSLLAGLMYLKEKELKDEVAIHTVRDMQGRIHTISLIHESLYQRDDVEHIHFQSYLERLSSQIMELHPDRQKVVIGIQCGGFDPELSLAMPLSMMMNELITNSLKHAFKNTEHPEITIVFDTDDKTLTYSDNGPGYDPQQTAHSLGQRLLNILATQINATLNRTWVNNRMETTIQLTEQAN